MDARGQSIFLALILTQAAHSLEEYAFRLYEVFVPARLISHLFSDDLATGFAIFNIALVLVGLWCYRARVRRNHPSARRWTWFWTALELGNGIGHPIIALFLGGYFPGVITAVPLLLLAITRGIYLIRHPPSARATQPSE